MFSIKNLVVLNVRELIFIMIFLSCKSRKFESGNMVAMLSEEKSLPARYSGVSLKINEVCLRHRENWENITSRDCLGNIHLAPFCLRALER